MNDKHAMCLNGIKQDFSTNDSIIIILVMEVDSEVAVYFSDNL